MRAVTYEQGGGPDGMRWSEVADPVAGPGDVLVRTAASAVNRADLLQVAGHYPVPPGASEILGLECSGEIVAVGDDVTGWSVGDRVCALLAGGGYAELVAVPATQLLPVPDGVDLVTAAGLPEVCCTVWSNLVLTAGLTAGDRLLVHGGGSGIGTTAIQVGRALGARVAVTAGRPATLQRCAALGAELGIDHTAQRFEDVVQQRWGGVDVLLDVVGARYLARNVAALADGGRIVVIGLLGGTTAELDLNALMRVRGSVTGTTLRSRPATGPGSKAEVVAAVTADLWPLIAAGTVEPVVQEVVGMSDAGRAHRLLAEGGHVGKVLLATPGGPTG